MRELNLYGWIAVGLVLIGGINWGLVGLFSFNLISGVFGMTLARVIFIIVGVAAGYLCYLIYKDKFQKS